MANLILNASANGHHHHSHKEEDLEQGKKRSASDRQEEEKTEDATSKKLRKFQKTPLEDNVDYISLTSSLSLLQARLDQIKRDIKELHNFKKCIKESDSVKEMAGLVNKNTDYLKEIHYKGSYIKCPLLNWDRDYGLRLDLLKSNDNNDNEPPYEKIDEQYEIIKRDRLF